MPRRVSLPGASELFRTTRGDETILRPVEAIPADEPDPEPVEPEPRVEASRPAPTASPAPRGTGRVKHDEKITVYVSSDELLALERARLTLRAEHKMAVDRGRIVRQALAMALEELEHGGESSELVRRLSS